MPSPCGHDPAPPSRVRENLPHTSASAASRGRGTTPLAAREAVIGAIAAKPLVHAQLEVQAIRRPGQISQRAFVVTMDTLRCGTQRTRRRGLSRVHAQGERRRGGIDLVRLEAQRGGVALGNTRVRTGVAGVEMKAAPPSIDDGCEATERPYARSSKVGTYGHGDV